MHSRLTKEQEEKYLSDGGALCPFCESPDIESMTYPDIDGPEVVSRMKCLVCKEEWNDLYILVGVLDEDYP